ncbi:hypothetical protein NG726_17745 [Pseudomonas sp. MOB-449]|nr:hypothetical protein [Pseudomonas sp. MOB-449]
MTNPMTADEQRQITIRARALCALADADGHVNITEGSLWLSTRSHMEAEYASDENADNTVSFSRAPYWIEMCGTEPIPILGPDDPDLLEYLL